MLDRQVDLCWSGEQALLPEAYIAVEPLRLAAHKKIASVQDAAALDEVHAELNGRYSVPLDVAGRRSIDAVILAEVGAAAKVSTSV